MNIAMPKFNKVQLIFLSIVMLITTFGIAGLLSYYWYFGTVMKVIKHFEWWRIFEILFSPEVPSRVKVAGYKSVGIGFCVSLMCPVIGYALMFKKGDVSLYGDAKFASLKDIQNSNSVSIDPKNTKGIVVGKYQGKLVKYLKPDFVSLGAGTRSGKGASVVIPNLLEWQDSLIVLDIKQECFNITSKYRKEILQQEVFLFAPFSFNTHKFNPLYYVDLAAPEGSTDLMGIAEIIFPTDGYNVAENHCNNASQSLFIALAKLLWLILEHKPALIRKWQALSTVNSLSIGNLFLMYTHIPTKKILNIVEDQILTLSLSQIELGLALDAQAKLTSFLMFEGEGKASIIATFEKQLKLFALPVVKNATDSNNFNFKDLRRKKMSIYLSVEPKDIKIASLIINLFFNCAIKINLSENPDFNPDLRHNLLLILDEFPAIGKIPYVKESSGYIAGYKLQLLTIYQNVSQLNEIYGMQGRKTLLANHSCKIVFAPNEQDDAEYFSNEIAFTTTCSISESRNHGRGPTSHGESASQAKRPLMLPQELKQMPFKEEIVLLNGENPIKCEKALYFTDPYFMQKLTQLSYTLQLYTQGNKLPTKDQLIAALNKGELAATIL